MKYNPQEAVACLPAGTYQATLKAADETTSKAGKDMLVLEFAVYGPRGVFHLKEYIVKESLWKLKRIAQAVGAEASFQKGEFFSADYVGKNLTVELAVEESSQYGDQNKIKQYIKSAINAPPPPNGEPEDDPSIPF